MKIAVTGSLGYVGSVLCPYILKAGHEVRGFDTGFFKDELLYPAPPYETVIKDARDLTHEDLAGFDAVVHLAAISNDPFGTMSEEDVYGPTERYAEAIARMCKESGIDFIFASSCSVYGAGTGEVTDEDGPTAPITPYSRNKLAIERGLIKLADDSFTPLALRFSTAYGLSPRLRLDLVINMLAGMAVANKRVVLNSDGLAWRPFIHVEDMAHTIERALHRKKLAGLTILNAGRAEDNYQIREVARMTAAAMPGAEVSFLKDAAADLGAGAAELVRDRKVDGADKRTYRVAFDRIGSALPDFALKHTVATGIPEMVQRLADLNFSQKDFERVGFYRLQRMEALFNSGQVDESLRWKQV